MRYEKSWAIKPFRSEFELSKGLNITKADLVEAGVPVVSYGQIHSKTNKCIRIDESLVRFVPDSLISNKSIVYKDDFIFADTSEDVEGCGNFIRHDSSSTMYAGYHTLIAHSIHPENSRYFAYLFQSKDWRSELYAKVNAVKVFSVTQRILNTLSVIIPPLPEQQAIVTYLDNKTALIDQAIEGKLHQQTLLREAKQALIAEAVTKGLDKNVDLKKSGISWLGEIPEHWEEKRIGAFFHDDIKLNSDFKYTNAYKFNYGTVVLKNETGNVDEYKDTYIKYSVLKAKDIVINGLNLNYDFVSQRVAYVPSDGIITSAYMVLRPRESVNSKFFSYVFKSMDNMKMFHGMGSGIRLTLSFKDLKDRFLPLPSLPEQQAIVEYIESKTEKIDHMIATLDTQVEQLRAYRQRLIADVVTGQKKVC